MKVQVAIARKVLTAVWYVMHDNVAYRDFTLTVKETAFRLGFESVTPYHL